MPSDVGATGGVQEICYHVAKVGASSWEADRLLRESPGFGPFTRGTYTARSMARMIGNVSNTCNH